jgi:hypothetical protein
VDIVIGPGLLLRYRFAMDSTGAVASIPSLALYDRTSTGVS